MFTKIQNYIKRRLGATPITVVEPEKKPLLFLDVLKEYIDKYTADNPMGEATIGRYDLYYRNISLFFAAQKLQDLPLDAVRVKHADLFRAWLKKELQTMHVRHVSRHVEIWKRVTKYAVSMEYTDVDTLSPVKAERDRPKKIVHLEAREIKKLMVYKFSKDTYRCVTDLFLFQCFTGLSYSDIWRYSIVEKSGKLWIEGERQKSNESYLVYLFPEAQEILNKYQNRLPRISNSKYNVYLKEIADIVGIRKRLTTHIGRKTHATILAERGMGTRPISMILGNTERVCDESYISKSLGIIDNEINRLGLDKGLLAAYN